MRERRGELARSARLVFAGLAMAAATFTAAALLDPNGFWPDASTGHGAVGLEFENGRLVERSSAENGNEVRRELDEARNPDDANDGVGDDLGRPGLRKPRGITPPWRDHAIPELRKRPDRKTKKFHA